MKHATRFAAMALVAVATPACSQDGATSSYADGAVAANAAFPDSAWRTVDPENLMVIETTQGTVGVELYPEIAPLHVAQMKTLVRDGFYDDVPFHRVIDGFMNQTGDGSNGNGTGDSDLPDIPAEFTFRRGEEMGVTLVGARGDAEQQIATGFYKALPVMTQPISQAILTKDGKVQAAGLHCRGVTSAARTSDPNSANSQFFLMRGRADHLDTQYSIWGSTVMGREHLESFNIGTVGDNLVFEPDTMTRVRIAADIVEGARPTAQVLDTGSDAFSNWIATQTYDDICDVEIPTRTIN